MVTVRLESLVMLPSLKALDWFPYQNNNTNNNNNNIIINIIIIILFAVLVSEKFTEARSKALARRACCMWKWQVDHKACAAVAARTTAVMHPEPNRLG